MAHLRFSLRWLLLIVLIVAAYLGGFVHGRLLSAKREAALNDQVNKLTKLMYQIDTERAEALLVAEQSQWARSATANVETDGQGNE